ncbi:zinc ribbon domain-containing protein [Phenylobacterium sp. LjRoot225]|uniref:Zn-ribbon domain-containing OB-fold protein n=1 Tax=Phenylobacterium sp. LjRoot225 TaxID=3342285 RepID=UPI003ECC5F74
MSPRPPLSDHEVFDLFPNVMISRDNIEHYRALAEGRLLINRCDDCGHWIYPHRPLCPECFSWKVRPTQVSGRGRVFTFTRLQQLRDPDAFLAEPVTAAAVELEEQAGLRYLARIVNCPRDQIALDMPVSLTWLEEAGRLMPAFEPAAAAQDHANG